MTKEVLSKELWALANVITGFAIIQAIGFCYTCLKPEIRDPRITMDIKLTIIFFLVMVTFAECYAIYWCTKKCIVFMETEKKAERELLTQVFKQVSRVQIIIVGGLIVPCSLCLFPKLIRVMGHFLGLDCTL